MRRPIWTRPPARTAPNWREPTTTRPARTTRPGSTTDHLKLGHHALDDWWRGKESENEVWNAHRWRRARRQKAAHEKSRKGRQIPRVVRPRYGRRDGGW